MGVIETAKTRAKQRQTSKEIPAKTIAGANAAPELPLGDLGAVPLGQILDGDCIGVC